MEKDNKKNEWTKYWSEIRDLKRPLNIITIPTLFIGSWVSGLAFALILFVIFELFIRYIDFQQSEKKNLKAGKENEEINQ